MSISHQSTIVDALEVPRVSIDAAAGPDTIELQVLESIELLTQPAYHAE